MCSFVYMYVTVTTMLLLSHLSCRVFFLFVYLQVLLLRLSVYVNGLNRIFGNFRPYRFLGKVSSARLFDSVGFVGIFTILDKVFLLFRFIFHCCEFVNIEINVRFHCDKVSAYFRFILSYLQHCKYIFASLTMTRNTTFFNTKIPNSSIKFQNKLRECGKNLADVVL